MPSSRRGRGPRASRRAGRDIRPCRRPPRCGSPTLHRSEGLGAWPHLAVLPEAELIRDLPEALAAEVHPIPPDDSALPVAPEAADLAAELLARLHSTTSTLNFVRTNSMPSAREIRWARGIRRGAILRCAMRYPGRSRATEMSIPNTPISGSYFIPSKSV